MLLNSGVGKCNPARCPVRPVTDGYTRGHVARALQGGCTLATLKSFYGVDIGEPAGSTAAATAEVVEVFEFLKPKASKTPLIRIGGDSDGSYLVPDDLDGIAACFSPGVNRIKYFEDFLADRYGIQSHMCDFSCDVEELTTPLKPGMQTFLKKWLDVSPGEDNISLEDWIRDHDAAGRPAAPDGHRGRGVPQHPRHLRGDARAVPGDRARGARPRQDAGRADPAGSHRAVLPEAGPRASPRSMRTRTTAAGSSRSRIPTSGSRTSWSSRSSGTITSCPPQARRRSPIRWTSSRNVPRNAPLFLSEAWCDYQRPLESRVKMLEDTLRYRDDVGAWSADAELSGALSLTMQSLQTLSTACRTGAEAGRRPGRGRRAAGPTS